MMATPEENLDTTVPDGDEDEYVVPPNDGDPEDQDAPKDGEDAPEKQKPDTEPEEETESGEGVDDSDVSEEAVVELPKKPEKKHPDESLESIEAKRIAALEELRRLRGEVREAKGAPIKAAPAKPVLVDEDPLKDVAAQDVELVEKVLKAKGYVRKDDLSLMTLQEKINAETDAWLKENPEFDKDNDPDDAKWNKLHSYISETFAPPKTPAKVKEYLEIARERLFGKKTTPLPRSNPHSVAAKKEKISVSAKSSSGSGGSSTERGQKGQQKPLADYAPFLKGFSEEEKLEILGS